MADDVLKTYPSQPADAETDGAPFQPSEDMSTSSVITNALNSVPTNCDGPTEPKPAPKSPPQQAECPLQKEEDPAQGYHTQEHSTDEAQDN